MKSVTHDIKTPTWRMYYRLPVAHSLFVPTPIPATIWWAR